MHSLLQTKFWAEFKSQHGWRYHSLDVADTQQPIFVLERPLPFGKTMLYAPEVTLPVHEAAVFEGLAQQAKKLSPSAIFFRLELFESLGETLATETSFHTHAVTAELIKAGYLKAFEEVQPEHRQWIDIGGDETTILSQMKEKCRYNVRLSQRKGIETRISTDTKDIEAFYSIFLETAVRDGFRIRSKEYFVDLAKMLFENKSGELVIAEYEGQPLAAIILTYHDGLASYLYGASSNTERNRMAPYAAHFAAIQAAKKAGCTTYDLLQIAPSDAPDNHPYTNLTRFKQQFGGQRVELVGGWDHVFQPLWYRAFKMAETYRRHK